jgi:hypothetical protein
VDVDAEDQVILEIHAAAVKGKTASAETTEEL